MNIPQTIPELYQTLTDNDGPFLRPMKEYVDDRLNHHLSPVLAKLHEHDELLELIASHTSRLIDDMNEVKSINGDHEDRINRLERQVARLTFAK